MACFAAAVAADAAECGVVTGKPPCFTVAGEWDFHVRYEEHAATLKVEAPPRVSVERERYDLLPVFNPKKAGWSKGLRLRGVQAYECTVRFSLDPSSVKIQTASTGRELKRGVEYELCPDWGTVGLIDGSDAACTGSVLISYVYRQRRIDTVVLCKDGSIALRKGVPNVVTPIMPECGDGETVLGSVYVDAATKRITDENILPLTPPVKMKECAFNPPRRTCEKLRAGGKVKIMAWGDSVTVGCYLPEADRWQNRFIGWLRKKYPAAEIELVSNA